MTKRRLLAAAGTDPLLVEVTRGGIVESRHAVDAAVMDIDGKALATWGKVVAKAVAWSDQASF